MMMMMMYNSSTEERRAKRNIQFTILMSYTLFSLFLEEIELIMLIKFFTISFYCRIHLFGLRYEATKKNSCLFNHHRFKCYTYIRFLFPIFTYIYVYPQQSISSYSYHRFFTAFFVYASYIIYSFFFKFTRSRLMCLFSIYNNI